MYVVSTFHWRLVEQECSLPSKMQYARHTVVLECPQWQKPPTGFPLIHLAVMELCSSPSSIPDVEGCRFSSLYIHMVWSVS